MMALSLAIFVSHRLWAQATPARPATAVPTSTKVALINLTYVIKHYERFKTFNEELKSAVKPFQDIDTNYKKQLEGLAKEAQDPKTSQEKREQIERQGKELQRKMEDNKLDFQKAVGKKRDEQLKILYMDIHNVVSRYAQAHGYDMVLHFHDALTTQDYWSAPNVSRKMQIDALMPMYYNGNLDISGHIVATLNASYKPTTPPSGGAAKR
jgi:Skp family chaperone for outer membrane proteins